MSGVSKKRIGMFLPCVLLWFLVCFGNTLPDCETLYETWFNSTSLFSIDDHIYIRIPVICKPDRFVIRHHLASWIPSSIQDFPNVSTLYYSIHPHGLPFMTEIFLYWYNTDTFLSFNITPEVITSCFAHPSKSRIVHLEEKLYYTLEAGPCCRLFHYISADSSFFWELDNNSPHRDFQTHNYLVGHSATELGDHVALIIKVYDNIFYLTAAIIHVSMGEELYILSCFSSSNSTVSFMSRQWKNETLVSHFSLFPVCIKDCVPFATAVHFLVDEDIFPMRSYNGGWIADYQGWKNTQIEYLVDILNITAVIGCYSLNVKLACTTYGVFSYYFDNLLIFTFLNTLCMYEESEHFRSILFFEDGPREVPIRFQGSNIILNVAPYFVPHSGSIVHNCMPNPSAAPSLYGSFGIRGVNPCTHDVAYKVFNLERGSLVVLLFTKSICDNDVVTVTVLGRRDGFSDAKQCDLLSSKEYDTLRSNLQSNAIAYESPYAIPHSPNNTSYALAYYLQEGGGFAFIPQFLTFTVYGLPKNLSLVSIGAASLPLEIHTPTSPGAPTALPGTLSSVYITILILLFLLAVGGIVLASHCCLRREHEARMLGRYLMNNLHEKMRNK